MCNAFVKLYLQERNIEGFDSFLFLLSQSKKEKGICTKDGSTEALGVVFRFGSNDIVAMESCDWPAWTDRTWRAAR